MIVAVHQPVFLPWLGYFYKMDKSDVFVLLDTVQYAKRQIGNRNVIKTNSGLQTLTVPVLTKGRFPQLYQDTKINNCPNWRRKHLRTLEIWYRKAKHFKEVFERIESIYYEREWDSLCDFNICLLEWIRAVLGIRTELVASSSLKARGLAAQRIINITKELGGTTYLSGFGGRKYQKASDFEKEDIRLEYYDFMQPEYPQVWGDFVPNCSVIDLLFNCGKEGSQKVLEAV